MRVLEGENLKIFVKIALMLFLSEYFNVIDLKMALILNRYI